MKKDRQEYFSLRLGSPKPHPTWPQMLQGRSIYFFCQSILVSHCSHSKEFLPIINQNVTFYSFKPLFLILVYKQIKRMGTISSVSFFSWFRNYQLLKYQSAKQAPWKPPDLSSVHRVIIHFTVINKHLLLLDPQSLYSWRRMDNVFFCLVKLYWMTNHILA